MRQIYTFKQPVMSIHPSAGIPIRLEYLDVGGDSGWEDVTQRDPLWTGKHYNERVVSVLLFKHRGGQRLRVPVSNIIGEASES